MFAYMVAEWRDWVKEHMARTVVSGVVIIALIGAFVSAQPAIVMTAVCLESLWLGWYLGNRYWPGSRERSRAVHGKLPAAQAVAGKVGAAFLIGAVHALAILPAIIMTSVVWGIGAGATLLCLLVSFGSFLTALGFGFLFSLTLSGGEGFVGTIAMVAWLLATAVVAPLRAANPFIQLWQCMSGRSTLASWLCPLLLFAFSGILFLVSVPLLQRLRLVRDE